MRPTVLLFLVACFFSLCLAAEPIAKAACKRTSTRPVYAVGNIEAETGKPQFIFTISGEFDCAKGQYVEGQVSEPSWMTFNRFPTLYDPLKLGHFGLRTVTDEGLWDGLGYLTFAINADMAGTTYVLHNYNLASAAQCSFVPDGAPTTSKVWKNAIPVQYAGNAEANGAFYWEASEKANTFTVRVLWDCLSDKNICKRTIGIQNNLANPLTNVKIQLSFDPDISPRTAEEDLAMSTTTRDDLKTLILGYNTDITPEASSTKRGVLNPLTANPQKTQSCWPKANTKIDFSDKMCGDGACSVQVLLAATLAPKQIVTIQTDMVVFPTKADVAAEVTKRKDSMLFYCGARYVPVDNNDFNGNVLAFFTNPPSKPCLETTPGCVLPGTCPCVTNQGTCLREIVDKCVCKRGFWGTFCEKSCGAGYYDDVKAKCICDRAPLKKATEQGYGVACEKPCLCESDSLCDNDDGTCWCHNGGRGEYCQFKGITCRP